MMSGEAAAVIAILSFGALVRSTLGFGEALVAVPLLALIMPVERAAPIVVLMSVSIAAMILIQDWRKVHLRSAGHLIVSTFFGVPFGLWLLRSLPGNVVKGTLAVIIVAFSIHSLWNRRRFTLENDRLAWVFGFWAGVLGGAYGMNGPPLAIYGALRGWRPEQFRATLQAYFLLAGFAGLTGFWVTGLLTRTVGEVYLGALPGIALAVVAGRTIHSRIRPERFGAYVYGGLAAIGVMLLGQALL